MNLSFIDIVFLTYMFVGLYMLSLLFFIFMQTKKYLFKYPVGKPEPVSIVVPCFNEGKSIGHTIDSLLKLDYPKEMIEIIVVDDCSRDDSASIVKKYAQKYRNVKLIVNKKNSGGAAEPTNIGIKASKYEYIAVTDADSTPEPDALKKMIGFLQQNDKTMAVTCAVTAKKPTTFMQRLQAIEYISIAFGRKLLDMIDSVYVTPGPFALYKKQALIEVGLFDKNNLTQDIEIVWKLMYHGYNARMCLAAKVYSETPSKLKKWFRQRVRWNIGGTQCILKYKKILFRKKMLGLFIIPYFSFNLFLGLFGLAIFSYLMVRRIIYYYLSTSYSVYAQTAILRLNEFTFTPTVMNFLGGSLFMLGAIYTFIVIGMMKDEHVKGTNLFSILFYMLIYLTLYPFVMLVSMYKLIRRKYSW